MNESLLVTREEVEIANLLGIPVVEYIEQKDQIVKEFPSLKKMAKLFAKHRGKKKPNEGDRDAAMYALNVLRGLGWSLDAS